MSVYLDASVLVPLFLADAFNERAATLLRENSSVVMISDLGAAEFSATVARRVRMSLFTAAEALSAFSRFDAWSAKTPQMVNVREGDVAAANSLIRNLDLKLMTPDAIHLAVARRAEATLATFDQGLARAARSLGVPLL